MIWDECFTRNEIRAALEQLSKGLDETYQHCMRRIKDTRDLSPIKALKWISYATRPLHSVAVYSTPSLVLRQLLLT
jgi:hypothetical protein